MNDTPSEPDEYNQYPLPLHIIHRYWADPWDGANDPQTYLDDDPRGSELLVEVVKRHVPPGGRILEIGCNAGRNLDHLYRNGYTDIEGVEISAKAVAALREAFPNMPITLFHGPVELIIKEMPDNDYDLVFSMAALEHIHYDSNWIFAEMVRITRGFILTLEDERGISMRHFPRNYAEMFEPLGMEQVEQVACQAVFGDTFEGRVFRKRNG
ncbi:MAG: class I SAM-dependent methyltransferase [Candidatus Hydrogenedentes bacterium]|nr:class I SAM-dependent methyltransferase [Candidatus Hydrogenedentota bacterium]